MEQTYKEKAEEFLAACVKVNHMSDSTELYKAVVRMEAQLKFYAECLDMQNVHIKSLRKSNDVMLDLFSKELEHTRELLRISDGGK